MNNLQINQVLLKRKQQILPSSILKGEFNQDLKIEVAQLNNVLMKLGYRLSYNLTQYLMMTTKEYILEVKVFLLKKIREMVGYAREMKPLFPNFPQVVSSMDVVDIIIFNIIYADLGFDRDAFDEVLNLFGIVEDEIKEEDKNISSNLKVIDIASLEDLQNLITDMINSKTVYSKQDKEDLKVLFEYYAFDIKQILPEKIYFKGWNDHIKDHNKARNFEKTEFYFGKEIADYCRKNNISSLWTHIASEKKLYYNPW